MKSHTQELGPDTNHHASNDELIGYLGGTLTEVAHERIQSHLVECDQCLELFSDVRDFFESHRGTEQMITSDIASEWRTLWKRINDEERPEDRVAHARRRGFWASPPISFALAAILLVAFGIGIWAIIQRREKQQLARQLEVAQQRTAALQTEQQNLADRAKQLEQENFELREQVRSDSQSGGPQRAEIRKPELNAPIYDLYARDFTSRSAEPGKLNRIKLPPSAKSIVLVLNGEGIPSGSSYGIEILGHGGQVIWRANGLRKDQLGNFTLTIDRSFLAKGTYRLRLDSKDGASPKSLAEYPIVIE